MSKGKPVYWHEGLFLRPQHFQLQDAFHEWRLNGALSGANPFPWGVTALLVNTATLNDQVFDLTRFEATFEDGAIVTHPGNARFRPRSFEESWDAAAGPLPVYLGIKKLAPEGINVELDEGAEGGDVRRFSISSRDETTRDLYARGEGQTAFQLEYNLRIFFGAEAKEATDHHHLQVAVLERGPSQINLQEAHIPPLLRADAGEQLHKLLRELCDQLTARGHELAEFKHVQHQGGESTLRDVTALMALGTVNRWIPLFHNWLEVGNVAPWRYYEALRVLAGELSTFSARYDVMGNTGEARSMSIPPYDHRALTGCFGTAARIVSRLLDELGAGPDFVAPMLFDGTYYGAELPDRIFQARGRHYLGVRGPVEPVSLVETMQMRAKLSSREQMPLLIAKSLPGAPLLPLETIPSGLPYRADGIYLEIQPEGPAWEAIREGFNAVVYFESLPAELEIEWMVIHEA